LRVFAVDVKGVKREKGGWKLSKPKTGVAQTWASLVKNGLTKVFVSKHVMRDGRAKCPYRPRHSEGLCGGGMTIKKSISP